MSDLNLIFAGTPDFAAAHLQALLDAGHSVRGVYTQPDRPAGRGNKLQASPVKVLAERHGLQVLQPASLKDPQAQAELAALRADLMIVVAYGLLLPQAVLELPRLGCINVHASLLPRWRGAAPIERALLAGDASTGITIMQMDAGLDTGNMLYTVETPITASDTRLSLESRLARIGCSALLHTLENFASLSARASAQDNSLSTYARKLDKTEALINWQHPVAQIDRTIRAGIGRQAAFSLLGDERIRFLGAIPQLDEQPTAPAGTISGHEKLPDGEAALRIAGSDGYLLLTQLQLPGKVPMTARDILNSRREMFAIGRRFSSIDPASAAAGRP
jgi:methionyl-tRNA formyltransferase